MYNILVDHVFYAYCLQRVTRRVVMEARAPPTPARAPALPAGPEPHAIHVSPGGGGRGGGGGGGLHIWNIREAQPKWVRQESIWYLFGSV